MIEKIIELSIRFKYFVLGGVFFLILGSIWAIKETPIDALPDLSPVQVILQIDYEGQSPKVIDEQVSFLLTSSLMSVPKVEVVRGMSGYGKVLVYVIFQDGTDIYWANSRILEKITSILPTLPKDVKITLGSDSSGIGWAFMYALSSKTQTLQELKALQDFYFKYNLLGVEGVSEVASIGGFEKNYEITLDSRKMVEYDIGFDEVIKAIRQSNNDGGGGVVFQDGFEKIVSVSGYLKTQKDIGNIFIKNINAIPLKLSDIAQINLTPAPRRGIAELNGEGEVVGGVVIVRYGANTYKVIEAVKKRIEQIAKENPEIKITPVYDRSEFIQEAIDNLWKTLIEECLIVLFVVVIFLLHLRSALIIVITLPLCVALSFLLMKLFSITSNIMSLGGIAIAIGAMVDASIVMVENAHKHLLLLPPSPTSTQRLRAIAEGSKQVGGAVFFALMIIVISFLPIFGLSGQESKLFSPLAYTKTFTMILGAILSITLIPILMIYFLKGKLIDEEKNPINRFFVWLYLPLLKFIFKVKYLFLLVCLGGVVYMGYLYTQQKWEFMPPLDEGVVMYMPVTNYGINAQTSKEFLQKSDALLKSFPEVQSVFGKVGSANTPTDPAPLSMIETFITLKPKSEWREGMDTKKLRDEFEKTLQIKGLTNSWTYPIKGRIDMLLTGIRTSLGIKVFGSDYDTLQALSSQIEERLRGYDGTLSVFAERSNRGYFLDIVLKDEKLAEYEISKESVLNLISQGVGGAKISTLINGVERYGLSVRFEERERKDLESIKNLYIKSKFGFVPLGVLAEISYKQSALEFKNEGGLKVNFIYITPKDNVTPDTYKTEAIKLLEGIKMPSGYYYEFSGESEYLEKSLQRMQVIIPLALLLVFVLILLALKNFAYSLIVFLTLPFSILGGLLAIEWLGYNLSIAVVVGFLALLGVATETAIVMIIYLDEALKKPSNLTLRERIIEGASKRVRPKLMTTLSLVFSLVPIMVNNGIGSEVMKRVSAPMLGGIISSMILTLFIVPICVYLYERRRANLSKV